MSKDVVIAIDSKAMDLLKTELLALDKVEDFEDKIMSLSEEEITLLKKDITPGGFRQRLSTLPNGFERNICV